MWQALEAHKIKYMIESKGYYKLGEKELLFNTYAFRLFSERNKVGLSELLDMLGSKIGLHHMTDLIYCAAVSAAKKAGKEVTFTDYDVNEWMDAVMSKEGVTGFTGIIQSVGKWISPDIPEEAKEAGVDDEKKS
jgi:hypothetical protein